MPRRPRIVLPGTPPLHLIQLENNRQACFYAKEDYLIYLDWLKKFAESCECSVHAYLLLTNHVHLLITPYNKDSVGAMMKRLGQCYVQYINRTYCKSRPYGNGDFDYALLRRRTMFLHIIGM